MKIDVRELPKFFSVHNPTGYLRVRPGARAMLQPFAGHLKGVWADAASPGGIGPRLVGARLLGHHIAAHSKSSWAQLDFQMRHAGRTSNKPTLHVTEGILGRQVKLVPEWFAKLVSEQIKIVRARVELRR